MRRSAFIIIFFFLISSVAGKNAHYYNKQGWDFLEKGIYYRASLEFKNAINKNPDYKEALMGLAKCYLVLKEYEESHRLYKKVLLLDNQSIGAKNGLGLSLAGLGKYKRAMKSFEESLEMDSGNVEAHYGMAYLYYIMGKNLWAKRKLESIKRINPFHYDSLLLAAQIKEDENRLEDAEKLIKRALNSNRHMSEGYLRFGALLLKKYFKTGNMDFLNDSVEELNRARAINSEDYRSYNLLGFISMVRNNLAEGIKYFEKSYKLYPGNSKTLYNMALAYEKSGNQEQAEEYMEKAYGLDKENDMVRTSYEDFLNRNNYKAGFPSKFNLAKYHYYMSGENKNNQQVNMYLLHLRKAIVLNGLMENAREELKDHYNVAGYDRFYIDELKKIKRLFNQKKYNNELNVAIIKRRNKLYSKYGYAINRPVRDVPSILVLDLKNNNPIDSYPYYHEVLTSNIKFAMKQMGRTKPVDYKKKRSLESLFSDDYLAESLRQISTDVKNGFLEKPDFILYGDYTNSPGKIDMNLKMMNYDTGVIIGRMNIKEGGDSFVLKAALKSAIEVYNRVPYKGRVINKDRKDMIINLGSFDGLKKGDLFYFETSERTSHGKYKFNRKVVLRVEETDTLISRVVPVDMDDMQYGRAGVTILPLNQKRARMVR